MNPLSLIQLELGDMANFTYIIAENESRKAVIIDPWDDMKTIRKTLDHSTLSLTAVLLTHGHYDHVGGADKLAREFDIPVYLSKNEFFAYIPQCQNLIRTDADTLIPLGKQTIRILATPGHTPGCQSFLIDGNLFTGDTLFVDAVGRTDFPGGNSADLFKSLARIKTLPDTTVIWPGHNYGARSHAPLGALKKTNPFLAAQNKADLQDFLG